MGKFLIMLAFCVSLTTGCLNSNSLEEQGDTVVDESKSSIEESSDIPISDKECIVDITTLQNEDGEYQYKDILWNSSANDVIEKASISFEESDGNESEYQIYKSTEYIEYENQKAKITLEFNNDKLQIIKLDFELSDDFDNWFDEQIEKLTESYGSFTDSVNTSNGDFSNEGYKWDTEKTTLQAILLTGDSIEPSATIGIGLK